MVSKDLQPPRTIDEALLEPQSSEDHCLPFAEEGQLELWSQGPPLAAPLLCVQQLFVQQVERTPERIALVVDGEELSYEQLEQRANRLADGLTARGVGPDRVVALQAERSIGWIVAILAILKAGGAYLPLDPSWPSQRRAQVLAEARPWLLLDRDGLEDGCGGDAGSADPTADASPPDPLSTLAYVLYTSGSTGVPKGVAMPHRALANLILWHRQEERLAGPARTLQFAAPGFDVSLQEIFTTLCGGGCLLILPEEDRRDPQRLWRFIQAEAVERLFVPYVVLEQLAIVARGAAGSPSPCPLRDVVSAGEALRLTPAISRFLTDCPDCRLHNHYGPTETHVVTSHRLEADPAAWPLVAPIGRPIASTALRVVDRDGHPCPIGVPGELLIGGDPLARGYLHRPELTAERFAAGSDPAAPGERWYRSGDLVVWQDDGSLNYLGRLDQQIKVRGVRIEPAEIEAALLAHPAVGQAAVLATPGPAGDALLVAYWVGHGEENRPGSAEVPSREQLRLFLAERLPEPMVPSAFVALEALPLTSNGKLDRQALPPPVFAAAGNGAIPPTTTLEHQLHHLWAELLGHADFGIADNFFHLGGHSLAAARLIQRISEAGLGEISVAQLFQTPTIAELAQAISGRLQHDPGRSLVTLQPRGEATAPLFMIHGGAGDLFVFLPLARALAPDRPVYGLQAIGLDGRQPRHTSVEQMAAAYAAEIRACYPSGPYHLIGYSAGGWYAHAVAAELLRLGGRIGLFAVVDTAATADLHRRVRAPLVALHLLRRLPLRLEELVGAGAADLTGFLRERARALRFHLAGMRRQQPITAPDDLEQRPLNPTLLNHPDYFVRVQTLYRPPRLPIAVDVLSTRSTRAQKQWIWRFYARRGVHWHPVMDQHADFFNAELMPSLADLIRRRLREVESGTPTRSPANPPSDTGA